MDDTETIKTAAKRYMLAVSALGKSANADGRTYFEAPVSTPGAIERWQELNDSGKALSEACGLRPDWLVASRMACGSSPTSTPWPALPSKR